MVNLATCLKPVRLRLNDLLLDPNNPRFSELGEGYDNVIESRFSDDNVQRDAFEKMCRPSFNVSELRDTIKSIGFLPMDRIVVKKWVGSDGTEKYVVIEGNRRVTALKWLINLEESGKEEISDHQKENLTDIECLELDLALATPEAQLILPGLRHVSGIKEWGPYQKAKAINALRKTGMNPQEAAQSLGLSTRAANNSYRCFIALENMKNDEEFGDLATPELYSFFEELFKKPVLKNWLKWDDDAEKFTNTERLLEFYDWITPPNGEDGTEQKIRAAIDLRQLGRIIEDEAAMAEFRSHDGDLIGAVGKFRADHPEDWRPSISSALSAIKALPVQVLKEMDDATLDSLVKLRDTIGVVLKDRESLLRIE